MVGLEVARQVKALFGNNDCHGVESESNAMVLIGKWRKSRDGLHHCEIVLPRVAIPWQFGRSPRRMKRAKLIPRRRRIEIVEGRLPGDHATANGVVRMPWERSMSPQEAAIARLKADTLTSGPNSLLESGKRPLSTFCTIRSRTPISHLYPGATQLGPKQFASSLCGTSAKMGIEKGLF